MERMRTAMESRESALLAAQAELAQGQASLREAVLKHQQDKHRQHEVHRAMKRQLSAQLQNLAGTFAAAARNTTHNTRCYALPNVPQCPSVLPALLVVVSAPQGYL